MHVRTSLLTSILVLPVAARAQVNLGPPTVYNAGPIPQALATHDLDGDGDADLAMVDRRATCGCC